MIGLLLLAALDNFQPAAATITLEQAQALSVDQRAERFLPARAASRVAGGGMRQRWMPYQDHAVWFWTAAEPSGAGFCRRIEYSGHLINRDVGGGANSPDIVLNVGPFTSRETYAPSYPEAASPRRCAGLSAGFIASRLDSPTLRAIAVLTDAMRAAERSEPLPFRLRCQVEGADEWLRCGDSRSELANLPLPVLYSVFFPSPAQLAEEELPAEEDASQTTVTFVRNSAPPDWQIARLEFGESGPAHMSWEVTLIREGSHVAEIRMRNRTVVYH